MRIKIPDTTTGHFGPLAEQEEQWLALASPGTQVRVVPAAKGPETIECIYDTAMCVPWLLEEIRKAEEEGFDAVLVPCMADPGLHAAREISNIPVVGLAETSFLLAIALGHRFSIMQLMDEGIALARQLLLTYGFQHFLASIRVLNLSVNEISADQNKLREAIVREGRKAVDEDGADVIVMSCGFMSGIAKDIEEVLGVPVIDPNAAGLRFTELLVNLGLSHSKRAYMTPPPKRIDI